MAEKKDNNNWLDSAVINRVEDTHTDKYMASARTLIESALSVSFSPVKTKVFQNLCVQEDMDSWNEMRANPRVHILNVKDLTPPRNAAVLMDPIRVEYREIDPEIFNIALLQGVALYAYRPEDFINALMDSEVQRVFIAACRVSEEKVAETMVKFHKRFQYMDPRKIKAKEIIDIFSKIKKSGV
ncbi:MAG: hypothetical protein WC279_12810 [Sulfurimonas sp.]|jgi:hypothetical protein|uniref:hypothetical protein n=1 Tax=Sulfurimonas sp. TaxID=2022749 RepID=UPI003568D00E